ncbi:YidH family protein [Glacieibacterium frigidum]|uniref:DUF202 domain-containing protein n=1 Tax=Glacieibacterium frigidum TaxID=2593303 RepID=A0A552UG80_9SPHN|nr:DUF202 domain-containing protein [Glacieibacterium frigidum]TRW17224.1 DUF202 domain-containing protein [Glacieibacterium frigidum]
MPSVTPATSTDCQLRWAYQRTAMAFERTFAAWIRTGLAALAFGIAIHGLKGDAPGWLSRVAETGLILFAALCFVTGLRRFHAFAGAAPADRFLALRLLPAMSWTLLGASLAALFEIWLA